MYKTPKQQLSLIFLSTLLAAFSLGSILTFSDPYSSGPLTHTFLYLSLFLVCLGAFTMAGLGFRQLLGPKIYITHLSNSFRQAFLISLLIIVSLFLQSQKLSFWWVEGSLMLFLLSVEIFLNLKV